MSPFTPYQETVLHQVLAKHGWILDVDYFILQFGDDYPKCKIEDIVFDHLNSHPFVFPSEARDLADEIKLLWK